MRTAASALEYMYLYGASGIVEFWKILCPNEETALKEAAKWIKEALDLQAKISQGIEQPLKKRTPYHHDPESPEEMTAIIKELQKLGVMLTDDSSCSPPGAQSTPEEDRTEEATP